MIKGRPSQVETFDVIELMKLRRKYFKSHLSFFCLYVKIMLLYHEIARTCQYKIVAVFKTQSQINAICPIVDEKGGGGVDLMQQVLI